MKYETNFLKKYKPDQKAEENVFFNLAQYFG